ncbi:MAG: hypothetical protein IKJ19_00115 [Clostridia bacterium]|nr:hypothetical protein [Clostridia bacterium]
MKKTFKLLLALLMCMLLSLGVACIDLSTLSSSDGSSVGSSNQDSSPDDSTDASFVTDLLEGGEMEILSTVSFETSVGIYDGTQVIVPSVVVMYGEEVIPTVENGFTLTKLGDYVITFTFELPDGSVKIESVTIISVDTTAPSVVSQLKNKYFVNQVINLNEAILVVDAVDENPVIESEIYFEEKIEANKQVITDNQFIPTVAGDYVVVVKAKDGSNNAVEKEFSFRVAEVNEIEYFNEEALIAGSIQRVGGATIAFNTNPEYIHEGAGSIKYTQGGTWTAFVVNGFEEIDWSNPEWYGITFMVYNPSEIYDYTFGVVGAPENISGISNVGNGEGVSIIAKAGKWTKVFIPSSDLAVITTAKGEVDYSRIAITLNYSNNGGAGSDQWTNIALYFDTFRLENSDPIAPTIVAPDFVPFYVAGAEITVPTFTAEDNEDANPQVSVRVLNESGEEVALTNGKFIATESSYVYEVTAVDANGNRAVETYELVLFENPGEYYDNQEDVTNQITTSANTTIELNSDSAYIREGNSSIHVKPIGTLEKVVFTHEDLKFAKIEGLTLWIYNPTNNNYTLKIGGFTDVGIAVFEVVGVAPNAWNKISFSAEEMSNFLAGNLNFGILFEKTNTSTMWTDVWAAAEFYIDGINLAYEQPSEWHALESSESSLRLGVAEVNDNGAKLASVFMAREKYGYPVGTFANSDAINWEGNKLTFKIYNNDDIGHVVRLALYKSATAVRGDRVDIQKIALAAYETREITLYGDEILALSTAYKHLGIYYEVNDNNGCHWAEPFTNACFMFYDFSLSAGTSADRVVPTTDDYKWAVSEVSGHAIAHINSDSRFVYVDGNKYTLDNNKYSLSFKVTQGNWPYVFVPESVNVDWANLKELSFMVYNPSEYEYTLAINTYNGTTKVKEVKKVTLVASDWTKVIISTTELGQTEFESNFRLGFGINVGSNATYEDFFDEAGNKYGEVATIKWASLKMNGLYFDAFEYSTLNKSSEDYKWTQAVNGSTGSFAKTLNEDLAFVSEGLYSLHVKPNGTWNTIALTHALNFSADEYALVKVDVYNPCSFDIVIGVGGGWGNGLLKAGSWTTVTVPYAIYEKDGVKVGLHIGIGHTCSATIDGVKYTNPSSGAADGLWAEFVSKGVYIDNVRLIKDTEKPEINVPEFESEFMVESVVTVPTFTVSDNIDSAPVLVVKVLKDGEEVALTDGKFVIGLGNYKYVVTASDKYGNVETKEYALTVIPDTTKPEINVPEFEREFLVGEEIYLPTFTATDNLDDAPVVVLKVLKNGVEMAVENGMFVAEKAEYKYVVTATDKYNNQTVLEYQLTITADEGAPVISAPEFEREAMAGDLITVPAFTATDDIDANPVVTVKVLKDGEEVIVENGTFVAQAGVYTYQVTATDSFANSVTLEYTLTVIADLTAPVITMDEIQKVWLVGEEVVLPEVTVSDDYDANPSLSVKVLKNGVEMAVENGAFVVEKASYLIKVEVSDKYGNSDSKQIELTVLANTDEYYDASVEEIVTTGGSTVSLNSDSSFIREGEGSVKVAVSGTYERVMFTTRGVEFAKTYGLTFWAYNPSEHNLSIRVTGLKDDLSIGSTTYLATLAPGHWNKFSYTASEIQALLGEGVQNLGLLVQKADNTVSWNAGSEMWNNRVFYLDGITFNYEEPENQWLATASDGSLRGTVAEINDNGAKLAATFTAREAYGYATGTLANSHLINWAGNKLTFKIYNNDDIGHVIRLVLNDTATSNNSSIVVIQKVCLAAYETVEITLYGDEILALSSTKKYLGIYYDMHDNNSTYLLDKFVDSCFMLYDFELSAGTSADRVVPTTEDYKWAVPEVSGNATAHLNSDSRFVYVDGNKYTLDNNKYSLSFRVTQGNWPNVFVPESANIDWVNLKELSFMVYNPSQYEYSLGLRIVDGTTKVADIKSVTLAANDWTKVTINASDVSSITFATGYRLSLVINTGTNATYETITADDGKSTGSVATDKWASLKMNGLYFDAFESIVMDKNSDDYKWCVGVNGGQGSFTNVINEDSAYIKEGCFSLHTKPNGTWNSVALSHALEVSATTITFSVYNPCSFDVVIGMGTAWGTFVAKAGAWTEYTVNVADAVTDKGLEFRIGHTCSVTIDGVKYTNPSSGATDGLWDELKSKGIYVDNIVLS